MKGAQFLMTNENFYLSFESGIIPPEGNMDNDLWFLFYNNKLLVRQDGDKIVIPSYSDIQTNKFNISFNHYLGKYHGRSCFAGELAADITDKTNFSLKELRPLIGVIEEEMFLIAGRAIQIINWDLTHKYCGRCGTPTYTKSDERAKVCPKCGLLSFPRLSPAIIVAVKKDNRLLLAHNKAFKPNLYSLIAGFVEPGETFEECVMREIKEEVGIKVKNIRYFGSQSWPFPHSMMVGFTAEYAEGDIKVDGVEIEDAGWFTPDSFPDIPAKGSISRQLIDWFVENHK